MLGGDKREQEIARLAAATGADVRAYGFPWPEQGIPGVKHLADPAAVLKGARFALFPDPRHFRQRRAVCAGGAGADHPRPRDARRHGAARPHHPRLGRQEPEGALRRALDRAARIRVGPQPDAAADPGDRRGPAQDRDREQRHHHPQRARLVVGQGTIGAVLARYLVALGAHTHVAARNPEQRSAAYVAGATPHTLDELPALAPRLDFVFSTVPTRVVGEDVLATAAEACADRRSRGAAGRRRFRCRQAARADGDLGPRARQPRAGHRRRQPMGRHPRAHRENLEDDP